jgi:tetratricopeptide (TPR) repeat protein
VVDDVDAVQKLYGKGERNVAGFYMGSATGSVAYTPRSSFDSGEYGMTEQVVLFHEYAHHFMLGNYGAAFPAWLIEGYAEFHSTARDERDGSVGIGIPAFHRAYGLMGGPSLSIEKLLTVSGSDLKPGEADTFYGRGWLLIHYLSFERSRGGQLDTYLKELNNGTPSLEAAKKAFGDLKKLQGDLNAYLRRPSFTYEKILPSAIKIGPVAVRELSPGEEAVMGVRMRSKRGVDRAEATKLVPLARKAAAAYPDVAFAQVTLAEAEYDAGNYKEAEAAADRAIAADPKSVEGLIYKGRARMALADAEKVRDPKVWAEIRKFFRLANSIDAEDPEPLMLFYTSFLAAGMEPTKNAAAGLAYALALAPQDDSLRWMAGQQHLRDGKAPEARAALAPLAFDPHGGESAKWAGKIIAKLDSGGVEAALAEWEQMGKTAEAAAKS